MKVKLQNLKIKLSSPKIKTQSKPADKKYTQKTKMAFKKKLLS